MKFILYLIIIFYPFILHSQKFTTTDSIINLFYSEDEDIEEEELIYECLDCISNDITLIDVQLQNCLKINDKSIFPSKSYIGRDFIKDRITNFKKINDTVYFNFVIKFQCCSKFDMSFTYLESKTIDVVLNDISESYCMCICPFYFKCKIIDPKNIIDNFKINNQELEITDAIFDNVLVDEKKNIIKGITTIRYYEDYLHENYLLQEKKINRKNEVISNKFYLNHNLRH